MKYKVRDKQTGQIIEVEDKDLGSYGLSAPATTSPTVLPPTKPKSTSLVEGINNVPLLGGLLSGLTRGGQVLGFAGEQAIESPFLQKDISSVENRNKELRKEGSIKEMAQKLVEMRKTNPNASIEDVSGYDQRALKHLDNYSNNASAFYTNNEIKDKFATPKDTALTTAKGMADIASYLIPGGAGALGKGATALGRGALSGFGGSEKGNELLGTGLGAVTSLGFQGLTSGAGKLVNKATDKISENLLNLTPGQRVSFKKSFGADPVSIAQKFGIVKGSSDDVAKVLDPLQDRYDYLAIKSGKDVLVTDVLKAFDKARNELNKLPLSKRANLATKIDDEALLFLNKYGNQAKVPVKDLTEIRRGIDTAISDSKFAKPDALQNDIDGILRNIFKGQIDKATGGKTKGLGSDISKLLGLQKAFDKREFSPMQGVLKSLGLDVAGAGVGAGIGYSQGGDIKSALAGGATGAGIAAGINSKTGQQGLLKLLQSTQSAGDKIGGGDRISQLLGGQLGGAVANQVNVNGSQQPQSPQLSPQTTTESSMGMQPTIETNQPQQTQLPQQNPQVEMKNLLLQAMVADMASGGKNIGDINTIATAIEKMYPQQQEVKLSEADKKLAQARDIAEQSLGLLEEGNIETGVLPALQSKIGEITGSQSDDVTDFKSKITFAKSNFRTAMIGAGQTESEAKNLADAMFDLSQPKSVILQRIKTFVDAQNNYLNKYAGKTAGIEDLLRQAQQ